MAKGFQGLPEEESDLIPSTDTVAKNHLLLQFRRPNTLSRPQRTPGIYKVHRLPRPNFLIRFLKR